MSCSWCSPNPALKLAAVKAYGPSRQLRQSGQRRRTAVLEGCTSQQSWVTRNWYIISVQAAHECKSVRGSKRTTYRPPTKWRPVKCLTNGFGAVKLTSAVGIKELPKPDFGGPCSMSHDDGASTEVTGNSVSCRALMTAGNGSLTSPEKLKPIIMSVSRFRTSHSGLTLPKTASTM